MASPMTPAQAWHTLLEGNGRFVADRSQRPHQDLGRRAETAQGQRPFALVFGCMDSRVAAELVFDRGIGDLAVVRTAGHVVDSGVLGSLEFGVAVLEIPLVVVLGHDRCGAIGAALHAHATGTMPGGYLREIVEKVTASMVTAGRAGQPLGELEPDLLTEEHVRHTVHLLAERSGVLGGRVASGACAIVGAGYRLEQGQVRLLDALGPIGATVP
ncbi:MAG TPA: carbonic anhydrase [Kineosporiaceae bacterium]|nr:carbonic anhydrase [Kineosporiaceae bacterium]